MRWLKHAFAVDPPGPAEPTTEQRQAVDAVCRQIVKRHLTTPTLLFLEMSRPLNYLGSQLLHFFAPVLSVLTSRQGHRHFAAFLEHRGSIDYLCRRIEELEAQATQQDAELSTESKADLRTDAPDELA
jgi:hypothetical protein